MSSKSFKIKQLIIKAFKEYALLFVVLILSVLVMFHTYIFDGVPFKWAYANDHIFQMNQFYEEFRNLLTSSLKTKSLPFYSWNTFLGNNFYASKTYYLTGDIFLPLLFFYKGGTTGFLLLEVILCIFISAIGMMKYLKIIGIKNHYYRIIFSLVYAIGGSNLSRFCYPMFHRFCTFMPFLFYSVELYLRKNKLAVFSIFTCILFLQNYYFMFPLTLFLPFYFIYSCYLKDEVKGFHLFSYLKKSIKLILSYTIGILSSMVIMLPGIIFILNSSRLTYNELAWMITWPFTIWLSLFYYLLLPITNIVKDNPFAINLYTDNSLIAYSYSISISSLGVLGLAAFFSNKRIEKRMAHLLMITFLILMNMYLPLNSVFHIGTTPTMRFTFILGFFLIIYAAKGLDSIERRSTLIKPLKMTIVISVIIILLSAITKALDVYEDRLILILTIITLLTIVLECAVFNKKFLVLLIVLFETLGYGTYSLSSFAMPYYYDPLSKDIFENFQSLDNDKMFKIQANYGDIPPYWSPLNLNYSMLYGFNSLCTYDTTYENILDEFICWTNSNVGNAHIINITNPNLFKLLGVKYVAVSDYSKLDNINQYEYVCDIEHLQLFKITDYNHFGHTFSNFINKNIDKIDINDFNWNNTLIIDDILENLAKDITLSEKIQFNVIDQKNNNNFYGEISLNSEQVLFFPLPYDKGWKFTDNGVTIKHYNVDGGFTALMLEPGHHFIEANFQPSGFKTGCLLSCVGIFGIISLIIVDIKYAIKKHSFKI